VNGYSMGMQGWNYGWMWICGLVLIVALILILRARK
jgi:Mg2+ and Co2+ transporter CorA